MSGSEVWSKLGSCLRSPEAALAAIGTLTRYATYKLEDKKQDQADLMCLVKSFKEAWEKTHGKLPDVDPLAPPVGSMNMSKPTKSDSKSSDAKEKPKKEALKAKTKKGKGEGMDGGKDPWGSVYDEVDAMSGGNDEVARLMASLDTDNHDHLYSENSSNQEPFTGAFEAFVGGFDPVGAVDKVGNAALGAVTRKLDAIGQPIQGQPAPGQSAPETFTGGNQQDLQKYGENVYIKEKERLIRSIAGDIFNMLKVKYNAKTAPIGDVVKKLRDIVPDPRSGKKFKPDFYSNSSKQKSLCHALAESINKHYGKHVLSLDEDPNELCNKAAEILYTLLTGLHSEVIAVMGDLARIIRNIELVRQFMGEAHRKMFALVQATGDQSAMMDAQSTQNLYTRFETELNRQMNLLSNNLSIVIGPTGKSLITLLESNKDFSGIVRELRADIGTSRFGDKLGYLLSGVADVAYSADVAEKALKVLGMNTGDLSRAKNLQELRFMVDDKIAAQKPTAKEFEKLMSAAELLYRNYFPAKETKQFVGKAEGFIGGCDCMNGAGSDDEKSDKKKPGDRANNLVINDSSNNNIMSGVNSEEHQSDVHQEATDPSGQAPSQAPSVDVGQVPLDPAVEAKIDSMFGGYDTDEEDDPNEGLYWSKRSISKKLKKQDKFRTLLFKDFKKKLKSDYRMLVDSINLISPHIGSTIPISDDLDKFIKLLNTVPTLNEEQIAEILSGYKKDVLAKEKRNNILSSFRSLLIVLEPLLKSHHAHFNDIALSIKRIMDDINDFGEKFLKAITEIHIETPDELRRAVQRTATSIFGSGEREDEVGSFVAFDKAKRDIYYYYKIATIRTDLDRAAKETASFGEGYEEMIGEEAAWLINKIRERFDKLINDADPKNMSGKKAAKLRNAVADTTERQKIFEAYSYMMKRQRDAKVKMVEVAQAIDLYLKAFTDGIAQHPNELKSIVKILDQVEIVAKWYNEKSGDNLATLFEAFPRDLNDNGAQPGTLNRNVAESKITPLTINADSSNPADNRHYYQILADNYQNLHLLPGNPFIGVETKTGGKTIPAALFGQVDKSVKGIRALENILSCFKSIGERFGGIDPQAKTFMNPGQIFNALNEYIIASSLTCGFAQNISRDTALGVAEFMTGGDEDQVKYPGLRPRKQLIYPGSTTELKDVSRTGVNHLANAYVANSGADLSNSYTLNQTDKTNYVMPPHGKRDNDTYGVSTGIVGGTNANGLFDVAMSAIPSTEMKSVVFDIGAKNRYKTEDPDAYVKLAQTGDSEYKTYDLAGWVNRFADTDHLFMMVMKSIAAKILTVIDVYRVFNRPVNTDAGDPNNLRTMDLNSGPLGATRTMLGGAEKRPQVVPDALELYVRLPLLAEWYREKFNFRRQDGRDVEKRVVSMVPNIDGIWSTFIKIIFDSAEYVKEGSYNEGQVNGLITEINEIYKAYKQRYPTSTVRQVINAFVTEINRIFGFLKKKEIDKYLDSRRTVYQPTSETKLDETLDYDILDAEDQFMRRPAPSDKYITYKSNEKKRTETRLAELHKAIIEFRQEMDKDFTAHARDVSRYSFVENLREQRKELDLAANDEEKYQVVVKAIQGLNKFNKLGTEKLLMIHETVAAPLALIYSIYTWLKNYNDFAHGNNFANVKEWLRTMTPPATVDVAGVEASYRAYLKTKYPHVRLDADLEAMATQFANRLEGLLIAPMVAPGAGNPRNLAANLQGSHQRYFDDLIKHLLSFVSHNHQLTSVHTTEDGKVIVEWNGLESLVMDLLSQVRYNIEKLKPNFTQPDILDRFESHSRVGSLFWLEEHLVEILFKNRDRSGLPESNEGLSSLWTCLISGKFGDDNTVTPVNYDYNLARFIYFTHDDMADHLKYTDRHKILGNDMKTFPFNILPFTMVETELRTQGETEALRGLRRSIVPDGGVNYRGIAMGGRAVPAGTTSIIDRDYRICNNLAIAPSRLLTYNVEGGISNWFAGNTVAEAQNGLLLQFNEVLARYLYHSIDPATLKIYPPLIEGFANGHASAAVMKNVALPDILVLNDNEPAIGQLDDLGNPAAGCNIWASLAQTIRTLLTNIDIRLKKKKHLFENLQEVPEHLKEKMRASLPTFSKLLEMINIRTQFFVNLITKTGLKDKINQVARIASHDLADESKPGVSLPLVQRGALSSADKARWYNSRLQDISNLALSLKKDCDRVYNELQDVPLYLETYRDSIRDFKTRHHVLPVMPLSSLLLVTNTERYLGEDLLLPTLVGTDSFRYNYGTRLVINRYDIEPSLDHMPGVKDVLNMYNSVANKASYFDPAHYNRFSVNFVRLARVSADLSVFNRWFDRTQYLRRLRAPLGADAIPIAYQLQANDLASVLNITENQNVKDSRIKLANTMAPAAAGPGGAAVPGAVFNIDMVDRQKLRVCNILDMNIVPINVNAFIREVPFVNILNYSYTFDRLVRELLQPSKTQALVMIKADPVQAVNKFERVFNTRELYAKLLSHPYVHLTSREYYDLFYKLCVGATLMDLGRPRFLSDQLWNKVLLNTMMRPAIDGIPYQEGGPASEVLWREERIRRDPYDEEGLRHYLRKPAYAAPGAGAAVGAPARGMPGTRVRSFGYHATTPQINDTVNQYFQELGRVRFDTKLVRNLTWFVNLQRLIRALAKKHLSFISTPVVRGIKMLDDKVTEYHAHDQFNDRDYDGDDWAV